MLSMKTLFSFTILSLTSLFLLSQSPVDGFHKGAGVIELGAGYGNMSSKDYFAGTNKIGLDRSGFTANVFLSAGLHDKLTLFASLPFISIGTQADLQDASAYLKYQVIKKQLSSSSLSFHMAAGFSMNVSDYETESGSSIGQQAQVLDLRPVVHFQTNEGWFITGQYSYLLKGSPIPDASQRNLKLGRASENFYWDIWYDMQQSDGGLDYRGTPLPCSFRQLGVDYHKLGATLYRPFIPTLGAFLGGSYILTGRNVGQVISVNVGIVWRLKG